MPKKIRFVDGFFLRNHLDIDFGVFEEYSSTGFAKKYIPKNEIWVDKKYKKELPHFLRFRSLSFDKKYINFSYQEWRKAMKTHYMEQGSVPSFVVRSENKKSLTIEYVDGTIVRKYIDPDFIFGGHSLVYDYIPKNKIWIDTLQNPKEIIYTLHHEMKELELMKQGMSYDAAHDIAAAFEKAERRTDGAGSYPGDENFLKKYIVSYT